MTLNTFINFTNIYKKRLFPDESCHFWLTFSFPIFDTRSCFLVLSIDGLLAGAEFKNESTLLKIPRQVLAKFVSLQKTK